MRKAEKVPMLTRATIYDLAHAGGPVQRAVASAILDAHKAREYLDSVKHLHIIETALHELYKDDPNEFLRLENHLVNKPEGVKIYQRIAPPNSKIIRLDLTMEQLEIILSALPIAAGVFKVAEVVQVKDDLTHDRVEAVHDAIGDQIKNL